MPDLCAPARPSAHASGGRRRCGARGCTLGYTLLLQVGLAGLLRPLRLLARALRRLVARHLPEAGRSDCALAAACCSEHRCPRARSQRSRGSPARPNRDSPARPNRDAASQRSAIACTHATLSTLSPLGGRECTCPGSDPSSPRLASSRGPPFPLLARCDWLCDDSFPPDPASDDHASRDNAGADPDRPAGTGPDAGASAWARSCRTGLPSASSAARYLMRFFSRWCRR